MSQFLNHPTAIENIIPDDLKIGPATQHRMDMNIDELVRNAKSLIKEAQAIVDAYESGDQKAMWETIRSGVATGTVQCDLTHNANKVEATLNRILSTIETVANCSTI